MYQFVLNMWVFRRITEEQVNSYATKGFIEPEEATRILATPQEVK
ncbi:MULTISPECIES: hypothetical protein [Bacillaceae]|nr:MULTISPECIES: hypothetical protein [Bacillaceae]